MEIYRRFSIFLLLIFSKCISCMPISTGPCPIFKKTKESSSLNDYLWNTYDWHINNFENPFECEEWLFPLKDALDMQIDILDTDDLNFVLFSSCLTIDKTSHKLIVRLLTTSPHPSRDIVNKAKAALKRNKMNTDWFIPCIPQPQDYPIEEEIRDLETYEGEEFN